MYHFDLLIKRFDLGFSFGCMCVCVSGLFCWIEAFRGFGIIIGFVYRILHSAFAFCILHSTFFCISTFCILHSTFCILHSAFLHSAFCILHSAFAFTFVFVAVVCVEEWMSGLCLLHLLWLIQRLYFRLVIWCVSCLAWLAGWLAGWLGGCASSLLLCLFQVVSSQSVSIRMLFGFLFFVHLPKTCQEKTNKRRAAGTSQAVKTTVLLHRYKQLFVYYYYIFSISLTKLLFGVLLCDLFFWVLIALSEGIFIVFTT